MIDILRNNPLLLLFLVAAVGYPIGRLRVGGTSLGVAAVLFVGLAFGALSPDLKLPEVVYQLGLIMFVYTIGLSSGPGFFAALKRKGLRDNMLIVTMIVAAFALTVGIARLLDFSGPTAAGIFAGSLTNTPALAGALEQITVSAAPALREQLLAEPVVSYSVTYPIGVIGMILAIAMARWLWRAGAASPADTQPAPLINRTIQVTTALAETVEALARGHQWNILVGRVRRDHQLMLASAQMRLLPGDLVSVVGSPCDLERVTAYLGEASPEHLDFDRSQYDYRRIFVSSPTVAGRRLRDLALPSRFGAMVTRVRRGDVELLPHGDTILAPGDRVRVVAPRAQMDAVTAFFGDSYRALSEIDVLTFSLGMALGVVIGLIPLPLPGGMTMRLGFAGGPLLVALVLGALERTGPLVWSMPYSANLTLRQLGLILFLSAIGTRAGYAFLSTLMQGHGLQILLGGALVTCSVALATLWVGHKLLRIPMDLLSGMLSGLQTQPAVLGFALEQSGNDAPNVGYATVYPLAMIAKILLAQLLLAVL
jgi:putative transport protein